MRDLEETSSLTKVAFASSYRQFKKKKKKTEKFY